MDRKYVFASLLALFTIVFLFINRPTPTEAQGGRKLQYKAVGLPFNVFSERALAKQHTAILNAQAADGWRLLEIKSYAQDHSQIIAYFVKGQ